MRIVRTESEIDEVRNWAAEGIEEGSRFNGMSYEAGIEAAIAWIVGDIDDRPDAN